MAEHAMLSKINSTCTHCMSSLLFLLTWQHSRQLTRLSLASANKAAFITHLSQWCTSLESCYIFCFSGLALWNAARCKIYTKVFAVSGSYVVIFGADWLMPSCYVIFLCIMHGGERGRVRMMISPCKKYCEELYDLPNCHWAWIYTLKYMGRYEKLTVDLGLPCSGRETTSLY